MSSRDMHGWVLAGLAALAASLGGCSDDLKHFTPGSPITPGGTGTGSTPPPPPDAGGIAADAGAGLIFGTVCLRTTVAPQACTALTGAGGLIISLRETSTQTQLADDGTFMMPGVPGRARVTLVTAAGSPLFFGGAVSIALDTSGAGRATIPVLSRDDADTLVATNIGSLPAGSGFLVVHTGTGITVGNGTSPVFYDTGEAPVLSATGPTGASGTAVIFGVLGTQTLSLVRDTTTVPATADVFAGAATFVEIPF